MMCKISYKIQDNLESMRLSLVEKFMRTFRGYFLASMWYDHTMVVPMREYESMIREA